MGEEYLTVQWAQSLEDSLFDAGAFDFAESGLFRAQWQRRGQQGLTYRAGLTWSGADYNPGIGFVTRRDFFQPRARLAYGWFAPESSSLRQITSSFSADVFLRNDDGTVESAILTHAWNLEPKAGGSLNLSANLEVEDLREPLGLPEDTEVPEGRYTFYNLMASYEMPLSFLLRGNTNAQVGTFYDGWRLDLGVGPTWNLSQYLELEGQYLINVVRFPDRDASFEAHIARLRLQVGLNTKVSASTFVQYSSAGNVMAANVRFRYNFREGNDLWIVYNEGINTDRRRETPVLPITEGRTVLLKYTYTFSL